MVLDSKNDSSVSVGHYRLLYKVNVPHSKPSVYGLNVDGRKLRIYPLLESSHNNRRASNISITRNRSRPIKIPAFIQYASERERNKIKSTSREEIGRKTAKSVENTSLTKYIKGNKTSIPLCHSMIARIK